MSKRSQSIILASENKTDSVADVLPDGWTDWRQFTSARIALGRAGESLPSPEVLKFGLAHAQARDAIHTPLDCALLAQQILLLGWTTLSVHSQAMSRTEYLRRPDLGRRLDVNCVAMLKKAVISSSDKPKVGFVIGDGLSSMAVQRHAVPLLSALQPLLNEHYNIAPVIIAEQARVALSDEIGEKLQLDLVVMLIGERPGLSSPDSLGIYITWRPKIGRNDAERNCISNVRPEGLDYPLAAFKLNWLIQQALQGRLTGVHLKDESDLALVQGTSTVTMQK
jgi:ethanolamine ammonia-lyase small subunit